MLDKVDPPTIPDGYGLSVGFYCLVEAVRTIQLLVEGEKSEKTEKPKDKEVTQSEDKGKAADMTNGICLISGLQVNSQVTDQSPAHKKPSKDKGDGNLYG